jgi:hypothetical protein
MGGIICRRLIEGKTPEFSAVVSFIGEEMAVENVSLYEAR